ncbi:MAG: DUF2249 domain-containing protein, partial [Calditrichaeota bacterium]|nr:DUF2249 domain-containing protein [Calditrichota bacterium]
MITADTKVKKALDEHPELKDVLIGLSDKLKKLNNPLIFKTVAKWATFGDVARLSGLSICEILHAVNSAIGTEKELYAAFPDCIKEGSSQAAEPGEKPEWLDKVRRIYEIDVREREDFFLPDISQRLESLKPDEALTVVNEFDPLPLKRMAESLNCEHYTEFVSPHEVRVTFHCEKPPKPETDDWLSRKDEFPVLDVRFEKTDPFEKILQVAQRVPEGRGFALMQAFEPVPLINLLEGMGFEHHTEKLAMFRYKVWFYKPYREQTGPAVHTGDKRVPIVVQSATPILYPIIMQLLKSRRLTDRVRIDELKVWEETEKHMAWIVNGRADFSFSAVMAAARLFDNGVDIKMLSVDVWDNFYVLTRGYKAENFGDLKGHKIHMPLFKNAPPAAVTFHLMRLTGHDPSEFEFVYGNPFGRPEEIKDLFVKGEADTVLLREPEASYALYNTKDSYESIAYRDIWKKVHPGIGNLPNAGLVVKGEFLREHPDIVEIFVEELRNAIQWVNEHKKEAAQQAWDIMRHRPEEVEL